MIRTIIIASTLLLTTLSIVHAADREIVLPNLGSEHPYLHWVEINTSPQEYEQIYNRNRSVVRESLKSYSKNVLELTGLPEQGIILMGVALDLAINGPRLDLNENKTLALEFNDVGNSERALYFKINLDW